MLKPTERNKDLQEILNLKLIKEEIQEQQTLKLQKIPEIENLKAEQNDPYEIQDLITTRIQLIKKLITDYINNINKEKEEKKKIFCLNKIRCIQNNQNTVDTLKKLSLVSDDSNSRLLIKFNK